MFVNNIFYPFMIAIILQLTHVNAENCSLNGKAHRYNSIKVNVGRRQDQAALIPDGNLGIGNVDRGAEANQRFTTPKKKSRRTRLRTTASRISFKENCDYLAYYCMKAYDTGKVCARTLYVHYSTFDNYCMMDYTNCMERYEVWQIAYMGECVTPQKLTYYEQYPYMDDYFMDQMYVLE